jgi:hypothetical protein
MRALEHALDAWGQEKPSTQRLALEHLVARCLEEPAYLQQVWRTVWTAARANEVDDFQLIGKSLRAMFAGSLNLLTRIKGATSAYAEATRQVVERADELDAATEELRRLERAMLEHWPWIDSQRVAEAMAEYRRGEYEEAPGALPRPNP